MIKIDTSNIDFVNYSALKAAPARISHCRGGCCASESRCCWITSNVCWFNMVYLYPDSIHIQRNCELVGPRNSHVKLVNAFRCKYESVDFIPFSVWYTWFVMIVTCVKNPKDCLHQL